MRPTHVEIDLSAIAHNISAIRHKVHPAGVMAVVKANAYGHGAVPVAKTAIMHGATWLGVALIEEGIELRNHGIRTPILVFGGEIPSQLADAIRHDLHISVTSQDVVSSLIATAHKLKQPAHIHVKVDTGMGRVGIDWEQAADVIQHLDTLPEVVVDGVYTHFSTSDEADKTFARLQLKRFTMVLNELTRRQITVPFRHCANSGAILDMPEACFDLVRPGIMMYGYYPSDETTESVTIRPAMTFKSVVCLVKKVQSGTCISYGRKWITPDEAYIATIPVGYADGYNRLLSNRGHVIIRQKRYPVAGRVCMDLILVDLGPETDVQVGDEVTLLGTDGTTRIGMNEWCEVLHTIPYEVCCNISGRVPRIYKHE